MSAQSRALDRASRLAGELVVDALFIVRRYPWHWPAVAIGGVLALAVSLAVGAPWLLAVPIAGVGAGFGMNAGTEFRFIARTPTRLLLIASSRVIAKPTRVLKELAPGQVVVQGTITTERIHRRADELVSWLGRSTSYPDGVCLLTGTGIVPGSDFTLAAGDVVRVTIDGVGTLTNTVKVV